MHITILALGSRGDIFPCLVLGQSLLAAGYEVRVITFESFADMTARFGLEYHPIPGDAEALLTSDGGMALTESGQNVWRMWQSVKDLYRHLAADIAEVLSLPTLWQTDAIINQLPAGLFGTDLAEKLKIPVITAAVMPLLRTSAFPMVAFPEQLAFLPGYNALTYRIAEQLVWQAFRKAVNQWRQEVLSLPKRPFRGNHGQLNHFPTLLGFSAHIVPRPADWGENVHITGFWQAEENEWQPPADLLSFLAAGPAPVFVGFGSMPFRNPQAKTELVLEALEISGQRAVLQAGWAGLGQDQLPDSIFLLDYAPYGWLFPQMKAVVHHGGSGTTGFGLRAGVPTILTPFLFDQFYWGRRLQALGVGPAPIPQKKLSSSRLAEAIDVVVSDTTMRQRAAELGAKIQKEEGVATAVALVKKILGE